MQRRTDLGSESHNSKACFVPAAQAPAGLASPPRGSGAMAKTIPVQGQPSHGGTSPDPCPRSGHAMAPCSLVWISRAAHELLQEQSPDPTKALTAVAGLCSWCAPRRARTVRPSSACPVTQEACGKARNKTTARKTSWQSFSCLNH